MPVSLTYCLRLFVSAFITTKSCFGGFCLYCRILMLNYASFGSVYLAHEKAACRAGDAFCFLWVGTGVFPERYTLSNCS